MSITDQVKAWPQEPQMAYHHAETGVWYWERLRTTAEALRKSLSEIDGLVDQQAMPDESWRPQYDEARAVLAQLEKEGLA